MNCVALFNGLFFFAKVQSEAARTTAESAKHVEEVCFDESAWLVEKQFVNLNPMGKNELSNDVHITGLEETHSAGY